MLIKYQIALRVETRPSHWLEICVWGFYLHWFFRQSTIDCPLWCGRQERVLFPNSFKNGAGVGGWRSVGFVHLVVIYLPLEATVEAAVCEEDFSEWPSSLGEAIWGRIWIKWEEDLECRLKLSTKALIWWKIFVTDDWTLPIGSAKNTRKRMSIQCRVGQKPSGGENEYPRWEKAKRVLVCVEIFGDDQKKTLSRWRKDCIYTCQGGCYEWR